MAPGPGPYRLNVDPEAKATWDALESKDRPRWKKINKALKNLKNNPRHPGLQAHKWDSLKGRAPGGGDIWTAYVENHTPSAWRIFFFYDANERGLIHIVQIEPHS